MTLTLLYSQAESRWNALRSPARTGPMSAWLPAGSHSVWWLFGAVLAGCVALAMLWMFHGVVRTAMAQGEARRATVAQHEMAVWHCARSGGRAASSTCVSQIGLPAPDAGAPSR
jgi:hypothetical protein